ncbi:MAG TPA: redox-sensing transcriptional repressor Rex [Thermoanaerobaculia bacterium]|nr:redox-sensing transcriptional repressor Rex [Thermoanaerobaculia bacterium]
MPVKSWDRPHGVPEATSERLSLVLRGLRALEAEGVHTVSSYQLADRFGLNPAQIRKDLAQFGEFGVRGVGYRVADLKAKLKQLMGLERTRTVVIAGAGNLGQALADSRNFNVDGFKVAALFDVDGRKIGGRSRTGVPILDLKELPSNVATLKADIGVLAVPAEAALEVARLVAGAGVPAILNFAPVSVPSLEGTFVRNVDLTFFLENLSFQLAVRRR